MSDVVTVCMVPPGCASKAYAWKDGAWSATAYTAPSECLMVEHEVDGVEALSWLLSRHEGVSGFVVRGRAFSPGQKAARRYHDRGDGIAPGLTAADRRWLCIDIDDVPWTGTRPTLAEAVVAASEFLPAWLRDVTVHATWSASTGTRGWDTLRLHLWWWLDRPLCDESLRAWARPLPHIDAALYNPTQPHYTATPRFTGAAAPDIGARSALVPGARAVASPPPELVDSVEWARREWEAEQAAQARAAATQRDDKRAETARERWAQKAVDEALEDMRSAPKGERNDIFNRCAYRIARLVAGGHVDEGVRTTVERIAVAIGSDERKDLDTVARGWEAGLREPRDLDHVSGGPATAPRGGDRQTTAKPGEPSATTEEVGDRQAPTAEDLDPTPVIETMLAGFEDQEIRLGDVLPDAPDPDCMVPHGYYVTKRCVGRWYEKSNGELKKPLIAHAPIVVTGRAVDVATGAQLLLIAWRRPDGWRRRIVPRADALDARRVLALAEYGLPVTSATAKDVASYLNDYEAGNYQRIPVSRVATTFGWQGRHGEFGCLIGRVHYTDTGEPTEIDLDEHDPGSWPRDAVAFREISPGDAQLASGFAARSGDMDGWRAVVRRLEAYPRAKLALLAGFSAPLVSLVGASNYTIDLAGRTSTGKTTALRVAASAWGDPDERSATSIIRSWNATQVAIERTLEALHSLPFFLDDTAQAVHPSVITSTLYAVAQGQGRARGNITRTEGTRTWRTVLISTGEAPATSYSQAGGARARTVQLSGSPFEGPFSGRDVELLNLGALEHHGHAGPAFVSWLLRYRAGWPKLRERYRDLVRQHVERAPSGPEARLAQVRALLELTHELVEKALALELSSPVAELWPEAAADLEDAAGDLRAFDDLVGWVAAQQERLQGLRARSDAPSNGWLGAWLPGGKPVLALFQRDVEEWLRAGGYTARAILDGWRDRGLIQVDQDRPGRITQRVSIAGGTRVRAVCVPAEKIHLVKRGRDEASGPSEPMQQNLMNAGMYE